MVMAGQRALRAMAVKPQIGDVFMEPDGIYGKRVVECFCLGNDPSCEYCDGDGWVYELIAPEHEIAKAFENIRSQLPENKH